MAQIDFAELPPALAEHVSPRARLTFPPQGKTSDVAFADADMDVRGRATQEQLPAQLPTEPPRRMNGGRATMSANQARSVQLKLVEEYAGVGSLRYGDRTLAAIPYRISRFQGMAISGLPIPGLHRIEGTLALENVPAAAELVGADVTLELEDGRSLALTVADDSGRVLAEGHGPKRGCGCC